MLPIGHFAFGAAMTTLLVTLFIPTVQYPRLLAAMGGFWAVVPDVGRVIVHPLLAEFPLLHGADIFWLHYTMTVLVDPGESYWLAAGMIAFFIVATFVAEIREFRGSTAVLPVFEDAAIELDAWLHRGGRLTHGEYIGMPERDAHEA